jgi:glucose-1-phosphate thymidylyltransferase
VKCLILAAGYATRLYPLTLHTPKALLDVAGRSILDRLVDKVERVEETDEIIVVSNAKFYDSFTAWKGGRASRLRISVLNDGSVSNEGRLGAVADIAFAVRERSIEDELLVLAGDNLFDFELACFAAFFRRTGWDCITTHRLGDMSRLRRTGVIEVDENWRVRSFEEKPAEPKSCFAAPPFYLYRRETLPLVDEFLAGGGDADAPGSFIPWLLQRRPVGAFFFEGERYDIGSPLSYEAAQRVFAAR